MTGWRRALAGACGTALVLLAMAMVPPAEEKGMAPGGDGTGVGRLERPRFPVLFGHQSVGADLLAGACEELGPGCVSWIHEWTPGAGLEPGILHFRVGRNTDPAGKVRAFVAAIDGLPPGTVAAAGFKFCFVDFDRTEDVDGLFSAYADALEGLARRHPAVVFYHCTVPLTVEESWPLRLVKRVLGRVTARSLNARRERFSELLRRRYGDTGLLFDLAALESGEEVGPGEPGRPGRAGRSLVAEWTRDGAHPDGEGARKLGHAFLAFVARRLVPEMEARRR